MHSQTRAILGLLNADMWHTATELETQRAEYADLRKLIMAHGTAKAREAAEHYMIGLLVSDALYLIDGTGHE